MAISLQKGGNVNLSKEAPGITKMTIGQGYKGGLGPLAASFGVGV